MSNTLTKFGWIGFCGLLTVVFIVLKLTSVIAWSWWWVLAPAWIPATIIIFFLVLAGIAKLIYDWI